MSFGRAFRANQLALAGDIDLLGSFLAFAPSAAPHSVDLSLCAGGIYLDPAIAEMVVGRGPQPGSVRSIDRLTELSARETEVLQLAAAGYTNKEVSSQLRIGVKTIETYKARAMEKLGLDTRAELVRYAIVKGWLGGP